MTYFQSHWSQKWAVAFCENTDHAHKCTALAQWLGKRWRNPLTNQTVQIPRRRRSRSLWSNFYVNNVDWVIQPLDICKDIAASADAFDVIFIIHSFFKTLSNRMTRFVAQTFGHSAWWKTVESLSWWCFWDYCWHMCWFFRMDRCSMDSLFIISPFFHFSHNKAVPCL